MIAGFAYDFFYNGTNIVILNPSHHMDQGAYNALYPVGCTYMNINATAPTVPLGVTATWTRLTTDQYLRIASSTPTAGGSLTSAGRSAAHNHTVSLSVSTTSVGDVTVPGPVTVVNGVSIASVGTESADHTHAIEPTFRSFAVYFRAS